MTPAQRRAFQQGAAEGVGLGEQPLVRFPQPQPHDGGVEVVAGPSTVEDPADFGAEGVDQVGLVGEVPAAGRGDLVQRREPVRPQVFDAGEELGGAAGVDDAAFGEHHDVGAVDLADQAELGGDRVRRGGGVAVEEDLPRRGGDRAAQPSGATAARCRS